MHTTETSKLIEGKQFQNVIRGAQAASGYLAGPHNKYFRLTGTAINAARESGFAEGFNAVMNIHYPSIQ